jgi:hypothetical protein
MSTFSFLPPACIVDFPNDAAQQAALEAQWNTNLYGFTQQGVIGTPWNPPCFPATSNYYNPVDGSPSGTAAVTPLQWNQFPNRIPFYFPTLTQTQQWQLADSGEFLNAPNTGNVKDYCSQNPELFGPYGPRGWQDEYCEWSIQYVNNDFTQGIARIDFTCENPEYWNTLWMIDPQAVTDLYNTILYGSTTGPVQLTDLYLLDPQNQKPVIDPSTGLAAYNPLNKWNSGTVSFRDPSNPANDYGGAVHLTSIPNTLQTEIGFVCAATVQRTTFPTVPPDRNALLCCAEYGQAGRNSDPNNGAGVYQAALKNMITLANPPGLYIQQASNASFSTDQGGNNPITPVWTFRGYYVGGPTYPTTLPVTTTPSDFILHATFEIPQQYQSAPVYLNGTPFQYGGQLAQLMMMQIIALATPTTTVNVPVGCVPASPTQLIAPIQLFHTVVFDAMYNTTEASPEIMGIPLLSNSTYIAAYTNMGETYSMTLVFVPAGSGDLPPTTVTCFIYDSSSNSYVLDPNISVAIDASTNAQINYAVPGSTYPGSSNMVEITVTVAANSTPGLRGIALDGGPVMPAMLNVGTPPTGA